MQVQIVDNRQRKLLSILESTLKDADNVRIAVAFATRVGLELMKPALEIALSAGATAEFLVGMDLHTTEPAAVWQLYRLAQQTPAVTLYCYSSLTNTAIYHPKIYLLKQGENATVVIGSSNLTPGGLRTNVEVNAILTGEILEESISDSYDTYSRLKFLPGRVSPDEELLQLYESIHKEVKKKEAQPQQAQTINELSRRFRDKANSLRRPTATRADLVGWRQLVHDSLPEGEFTNAQAYARKAEYQKRFPNNSNIEAKIRQQLQFLEKMGFIEHVATGRWKKTKVF